jgi:hypothetical protein
VSVKKECVGDVRGRRGNNAVICVR